MPVTETPSTSDPKAANTASATGASGAEESSGLLDIRDMAQMTKKRVTQRIETETDAEDALLAARPSALRDVVLPMPGAEQPSPIALGTQVEVPPIMQSQSNARLPWLIAAGAGVLLLVGGAAALLARGGAEPAVAAGAGAPAGAAAAAEAEEPGGLIPAAEEPEAAEPEPTTEPMVVAEGLEDTEEPEAEAAETEDGTAQLAAATETEEPADVEPEPAKAAVAKVAPKRAKATRQGPAKPKAKKDKAAAAKPKAAAKKDKAGSAEPDLDDLLDQAAGPVDNVAAKREEKAAPTKKRLTRGDINGALRKKGSAAQACADKHGAEGVMQIRLRVEPSGKVSSATPQGKFKGSNVGACVASVVKSAEFPPYAGAPMTVTFPFLLQ